MTLCGSHKPLPKYQAAAWSLACSGIDLEQGRWLRNRCPLLHPTQCRGCWTGSVVPPPLLKAALQPVSVPQRSAAEM